MSIDLEVVPAGGVVRWRELRDRWQTLVAGDERRLLGDDPLLFVIGSDAPQPLDAGLEIGRTYRFGLAGRNGLLVTVNENAGSVDEVEYLADYGRNLSPEAAQEIVDRWREAGHYYAITSMMGRNREEFGLLVALAAAIADLSTGYVVVSSGEVFDLSVGVYAPRQFEFARPLIS